MLTLFVLAALITLGWYLKNGALQLELVVNPNEDAAPSMPKISIAPKLKEHFIVLGGIVVLILAWGYQLKIYGLLYSTQGPAFGASYTDVHVKVWTYRLLILISIAFAILLFYNAFRFRLKPLWIGAVVWVGAMAVCITLAPLIVQKVVVKPNELAKESPYIAHNIDFTARPIIWTKSRRSISRSGTP